MRLPRVGRLASLLLVTWGSAPALAQQAVTSVPYGVEEVPVFVKPGGSAESFVDGRLLEGCSVSRLGQRYVQLLCFASGPRWVPREMVRIGARMGPPARLRRGDAGSGGPSGWQRF